MQSIRIDQLRNTRLSWPALCAMCNAPAEAEATASTLTNENYRFRVVYVKWAERTLSVSYPVCWRHRLWCNLLDRPARWGFINASLYLVVIPLIVTLLLGGLTALVFGFKGETADRYFSILGALLLFTMLAFYVVVRMTKPVRLSGLEKGALIISIRNHDYFRKFKDLNGAS